MVVQVDNTIMPVDAAHEYLSFTVPLCCPVQRCLLGSAAITTSAVPNVGGSQVIYSETSYDITDDGSRQP